MAESNGRLDRIEAALDRLTERHEALAQSFELNQQQIAHLAERGIDTDKQITLLTDALRTLTAFVRSHENRIEKLER